MTRNEAIDELVYAHLRDDDAVGFTVEPGEYPRVWDMDDYTAAWRALWEDRERRRNRHRSCFYIDRNIRYFYLRAGINLGLFRVMFGRHRASGWYFKIAR